MLGKGPASTHSCFLWCHPSLFEEISLTDIKPGGDDLNDCHNTLWNSIKAFVVQLDSGEQYAGCVQTFNFI